VSANDSFFLGFGEDVHDAAVTVGPVGLGDAVHQADVEVVGAEFAAEAVEVGAGFFGIAGKSLGQNGDFVARYVLERFGYVRMASVGIGGIEEAEPLVVSIEQDCGETLHAEISLVRVVTGADRAGAHGEATGLDAGISERDQIVGREPGGERCVSESREDGFWGEPGYTCGGCGAD